MTTEELIRNCGLRVTTPRVQLLQLFSRSGTALAKSDIELKLEDMDRITLYRTLKVFNDKGLIHRAVDGSDKTKYALCDHACSVDHHHDEHPHFYCLKCKETVCLNEVNAPQFKIPVGYTVTDIQIAMKGICRSCVS